jgi:hypothetical protein
MRRNTGYVAHTWPRPSKLCLNSNLNSLEYNQLGRDQQRKRGTMNSLKYLIDRLSAFIHIDYAYFLEIFYRLIYSNTRSVNKLFFLEIFLGSSGYSHAIVTVVF